MTNYQTLFYLLFHCILLQVCEEIDSEKPCHSLNIYDWAGKILMEKKYIYYNIYNIFLIYRIFWLSLFLIQIKMPKGTVKFFNNSKGFGFIKPSDGGEDVFVHVSALAEEIRENDQVSYEVEMGKKGKNAVKVKVID